MRRQRDDEHDRGWGEGGSGYGYGPGGEAYRNQDTGHRGGPEESRLEEEPRRSRDWAPYRDQADWPRRQHVGQRAAEPAQSFRGRGPRGYQRSDERIREDVCDRLTEDHDLDASDIDVKVEGCEVTLEGTVDERRSKWLAEEIAARCSGVTDVHNHLRVKRQAVERPDSASAEMPRNGGRQTQTAQTGLGAQNRTDR